MAVIKGSVPVGGFFAPTDDTDTFGVSDPRWGIGGFSTWEQWTNILLIPAGRRRIGMMVYNQDLDDSGVRKGYWRLINDSGSVATTNADWAVFSTASGLEALDEGNGVGWRLIGKDANAYAPIGDTATDLSHSVLPLPIAPPPSGGQDAPPDYPTEAGAKGARSFAAGYNNLASGSYSVALGLHVEASGPASFAWGESAKAPGTLGLALGQFAHAGGGASFAIGVNSVTNGNFQMALGNCNTGVSGARIEFGIGKMNYNGTVLGDRINGLELFTDGSVNAPNNTVDMINARGDRALVTKEYVTTGLNGAVQSVVAGTNITVDATDPRNPVVSATATTAAGVLRRIYFLADEEVINTNTYYKVLRGDRGVLPDATQTLSIPVATKQYFAQDFISDPYPEFTTFPLGNYTGGLDVVATSGGDHIRFTVEVYLTDANGDPLDSGIAGAPVGDLGKEVIVILDSGILFVSDTDLVNIPIITTMTEEFSAAAGTRVRFHISAERTDPTGDPSHDFTLHSGSDYNTYIDVTIPVDTDTVANRSSVPGATTTDALNSLFSTGTAVLTETVKVAGIGTIGAVSDGFEFLQGWDLTRVMKELVRKKVPPTYVMPTASISATPGAALEVGTALTTYKLAPAFTQNDAGLIGDVRLYRETVLLHTQTDLATYDHTGQTVLLGLTSYEVEIDYATGPIKEDSFGDDDNTGQIMGGMVPASDMVLGAYYNWYNEFGTTRPTTGPEVRAGSNGSFNKTFDIQTGTTAKVFVITIPDGASIKSVWAIGGSLPLDVTGNFILDTTVTKVPDGGGVDADYNMFVYENSLPYSDYTLSVTLH